jgi:pyruvate dehydrogenase E2 component (dihydrolipoamide acetyltransferase)
MEEGTITKWHAKEGSFVKSGDVLIEVATDKATVEYAAVDKGYLRKILAKAGDSVHINQPIAVFTLQESESVEGYVPEGVVLNEPPQETAIASTTSTSQPSATPSPKKEGVSMGMPSFTPEPELETFDYQSLEDQGSKTASPYAKKLAKEKNLDLSSVKGSGPGGRIVSEDLKSAQPLGLVSLSGTSIDYSVRPGSYVEEKLSPMRKVIGQRLQESKTFIPHFYVTYEIDVLPLAELRKQLQSAAIKLSVNDFVVKATSIKMAYRAITLAIKALVVH